MGTSNFSKVLKIGPSPTSLVMDTSNLSKVLKIGPLTYQLCDGYLKSQKVLRRDASLDAYSTL
jgi:hypothetical protein